MNSGSQILFKANRKQKEALDYLMDKTTRNIGYGGGAGGGKSILGTFWVWTMCMLYPGTRWFFGRKELTTLKKTTLNSYYKLLDVYGIKGKYRGVLNGNTNIIKFFNGSEIILLDLAFKPSDPLYHRLGSYEFTGGFIDESSELDVMAITILKTRLGRHLNTKYNLVPKLLQTFNPDKGHIYEEFYKPWKDNTLPEGTVFIPALATDNPKIDKGYIEQLSASDETTKQRLLYGNFDYDDKDGKLFDNYDMILDLFESKIETNDEMFISADIARQGKDKTVIGIWKGLELIRIVEEKGKGTDQVALTIKELEVEYKVKRKNIVVDTDGIGAGVADQLKGCINFHNNAQQLKTNTITNFSNLKTQCYFKLRELAEKRKIRLNLSGSIKKDLLQELDNIMIKDNGGDSKVILESKEELKRRIGRSPDIADMVMMRMYYTITIPNNIKTYNAIFSNYN